MTQHSVSRHLSYTLGDPFGLLGDLLEIHYVRIQTSNGYCGGILPKLDAIFTQSKKDFRVTMGVYTSQPYDIKSVLLLLECEGRTFILETGLSPKTKHGRGLFEGVMAIISGAGISQVLLSADTLPDTRLQNAEVAIDMVVSTQRRWVSCSQALTALGVLFN